MGSQRRRKTRCLAQWMEDFPPLLNDFVSPLAWGRICLLDAVDVLG